MSRFAHIKDLNTSINCDFIVKISLTPCARCYKFHAHIIGGEVIEIYQLDMSLILSDFTPKFDVYKVIPTINAQGINALKQFMEDPKTLLLELWGREKGTR